MVCCVVVVVVVVAVVCQADVCGQLCSAVSNVILQHGVQHWTWEQRDPTLHGWKLVTRVRFCKKPKSQNIATSQFHLCWNGQTPKF